MPSLRSVVVALPLLLGGCLPAYEWYRPGAGPAEARSDLSECSQAAEYESYAYRPAFVYRRNPNHYLGPNCGYRCAQKRAAADESYDRSRIQSEASSRASQLTSFCMRSRGYGLRELPAAQ